MGEFSLLHWVVVLFIALLFFGPSKLPQLGKSLGEAIRGFKKGIAEADEEEKLQQQKLQQHQQQHLQSRDVSQTPTSEKVEDKNKNS